MARNDGRTNSQLREIKVTRKWLDHAEGSVLVEFGKTRVLCVASFTPGVPRWLKPLSDSVAAVSVGIIDGVPMLDLCYEEDVRADTDMNVVCSGDGRFIEVQGTAEGVPFDRNLLDSLLDLAVAGCVELGEIQKAALAK